MEDLLFRHTSGRHSSENTSTSYLTSKSTNIPVSQKMSLEECISRRTDHLLNNLTCCWRVVQSCLLQQCFHPNWTPKGWAKKAVPLSRDPTVLQAWHRGSHCSSTLNSMGIFSDPLLRKNNSLYSQLERRVKSHWPRKKSEFIFFIHIAEKTKYLR